MTEGHITEPERAQVAAFLRRVVSDSVFRDAMDADPEGTIRGSGLAIRPELVDVLIMVAEHAGSVTAHMAEYEDIHKDAVMYAKVVDQD